MLMHILSEAVSIFATTALVWAMPGAGISFGSVGSAPISECAMIGNFVVMLLGEAVRRQPKAGEARFNMNLDPDSHAPMPVP